MDSFYWLMRSFDDRLFKLGLADVEIKLILKVVLYVMITRM